MWSSIYKHYEAEKWRQFDQVQEEVDELLWKVEALMDAPHHEACIRFRIYSWRKRKDGEGLWYVQILSEQEHLIN